MKVIKFLPLLIFIFAFKCNETISIKKLDTIIVDYLKVNKKRLLYSDTIRWHDINVYVSELTNDNNKKYNIYSIVASTSRGYGRFNNIDTLSYYKQIKYEKDKINVFYNFLSEKKNIYKIHYPNKNIELFYTNDDMQKWIIVICKNGKVYIVKKPEYYYVDENGEEAEFGFMKLRMPKNVLCN